MVGLVRVGFRVRTWVRVVILFGVRVRVVFRVRAWVRPRLVILFGGQFKGYILS